MRYYSKPVEWSKSPKLAIPTAYEDVEQQEHSLENETATLVVKMSFLQI